MTATQLQRRHVEQQSQKSAKVERSSKQLLGELYSDKEYLEKLLKDKGVVLLVSRVVWIACDNPNIIAQNNC